MRAIALALVCLACAADGRKVETSGEDPVREFAQLLLALKNPSAGWQHALNNRPGNLARWQPAAHQRLRSEQPRAIAEDHVPFAGRRAALGTAAIAALWPLVANARGGAGQEGMRSAEDIQSLQQISPETTGSLGAGTISSRSRPVTGVILLEEVKEAGDKQAPGVSAEMVLDGGIVADVQFQAVKGFPLNRGMFYDVEVKQVNADASAFIHVAKMPEGKTLADVGDDFFTNAVFDRLGRYGAYGAPTSISVVKKSKKEQPLRIADVSFVTLSPSQREVERRCLIAAMQPPGSQDAVMLVASASSFLWSQSEPALRKMASSLKVASTRPTNLKRTGKVDYRFEDFGGLKVQQNKKATTFDNEY